MDIRMPAVAGQFYPATASRIEETFRGFLRREKERIDISLASGEILGGIVPHAGYVYSGHHAVHFFEILARSGQKVDTVVIVNPNHSGYGPDIALDTHDAWRTPMGEVMLDREMMQLLPFPSVSVAHDFEHSGEVMVPFLQFFLKRAFKIVPVSMGRQSPMNARSIATSIHEAARKLDRKIIVIASSDFSHFLTPEAGSTLDGLVLDHILKLDPEGVADQVKVHNITVCGFGPIMTLIEYSQLSGPDPKVKVLSSGHSGEVTPTENVVDYITILFYRERQQ